MRNGNNLPMPSIALVGCGYWGKNLVRNFFGLKALTALCDSDQRRTTELTKSYPVPAFRDFDEMLKAHRCDAIAIAAPAAQHFELTAKALRAGKDVFVEKPLALSAEEGQKLVDLAQNPPKGRELSRRHQGTGPKPLTLLELTPISRHFRKTIRERAGNFPLGLTGNRAPRGAAFPS